MQVSSHNVWTILFYLFLLLLLLLLFLLLLLLLLHAFCLNTCLL